MKTLAIRVSNARFSGQGHIQRCILIRRLIKHKVIWFLDESCDSPSPSDKMLPKFTSYIFSTCVS